MNDRQLKYILAIAKEGNLSTAARKLYISQPSLSSMLEHVEAELDAKLFYRTSGGMKLTPAGVCYVQTAKTILGNLEDLNQQLSDFRDNRRGRMSIGCSPKKSDTVFPHILPKLKEQFPLYQFILVEDTMDELNEMLSMGDIDVAFLYSSFAVRNVKSVPFSHEEICLIVPMKFDTSSLPCNEKGQYVMTDYSVLRDTPFVLFKKGRDLRKMADKILADIDVTPHVLLETNTWQTCLAMVETGQAVSFLPINTPEARLALTERSALHTKQIVVGKSYHRSMSVYYRENMENTAVMRAFLSICSSFDANNPA